MASPSALVPLLHGRGRQALVGVALLLLSGCKVGGCVAATLGDIVGETGDVACDRRFVTGDKEPAPFCQEVIDTVATSQVADDCRDSHHAQAYEHKCPRDHIIAGCKIHKDTDDGSEVWDWYYDVSDLEDAAAHDASRPDDAGPIFADPVLTKDDVRALCADKERYGEGATYDENP